MCKQCFHPLYFLYQLPQTDRSPVPPFQYHQAYRCVKKSRVDVLSWRHLQVRPVEGGQKCLVPVDLSSPIPQARVAAPQTYCCLRALDWNIQRLLFK